MVKKKKEKNKLQKILSMKEEELNNFLGFNLQQRMEKGLKNPMKKMIEFFLKLGYEIKEREIEMEEISYY